MDMCITGTGTEHKVFLLTNRNSWISEESIMQSNSISLSSYLLSQENIRELIKIEEVDPTSGDGGCCSSGANVNSKDVYTFCKEEYIGDESEINSTQFPSETQLNRQFTMRKYLRQHQNIPTGEKHIKCNEYGKSSQISVIKHIFKYIVISTSYTHIHVNFFLGRL